LTTLGIIGCGYWGPNLVRNFHGIPGANVKTVSDLRPGRLESLKGSYPQIGTTLDYRQIIDDPEIDAVVIVTPVETHYALAEKPLTRNSREGWALVEQARSLGRVVAVGHVFQFAPGVRRIKREIEAGSVGKVHHISSTRINLGPPDPKLDVVWDLGPHDVSIILHLLGETPVEVRADGQSYQRSGVIDNAHIHMAFPSGSTAHIHVSWLSASKTRLLQLFGERGSIVYDEMLALDGKVKLYDRGIDNRTNVGDNEAVTLGYSAGDIHLLHLEQHEPLNMECREFIRAVDGGGTIPNDGEMGAKVVELLEWASEEIHGGVGQRRGVDG
jgi:predicted dehydrogenase